jgi:lambda family phage minor tail protein L
MIGYIDQGYFLPGYLAEDLSSEVQKLAPSAIVELFEVDTTSLGGELIRFHAGTNGLMQRIVWQGNEYEPFPVKVSGFELSANGQLPRPKLMVANVTGIITTLVLQYQDLIGAKVTRKRTLAKYLDAVNFPGSVNPTADPDAAFPNDSYFIDRKSTETRDAVEFELAASIDLQGVMLPRRQIIQNVCSWRYRGTECGYAGTNYFDAGDVAVANLSQDVCGKRLSSCKIRFGQTQPLPFGGFPAAGLIR